MKNYKQEPLTFDLNVINEYWIEEVEENDIKMTFYFWRRLKGCKGYFGEKGRILRVVGVRNGKKRRIETCMGGVKKEMIEIMKKKFGDVDYTK